MSKNTLTYVAERTRTYGPAAVCAALFVADLVSLSNAITDTSYREPVPVMPAPTTHQLHNKRSHSGREQVATISGFGLKPTLTFDNH
jgi:hypothetical protein